MTVFGKPENDSILYGLDNYRAVDRDLRAELKI